MYARKISPYFFIFSTCTVFMFLPTKSRVKSDTAKEKRKKLVEVRMLAFLMIMQQTVSKNHRISYRNSSYEFQNFYICFLIILESQGISMLFPCAWAWIKKFIDPPFLGGHYFRTLCTYVSPSVFPSVTMLTSRPGKQNTRYNLHRV